MVGGNLKFIIVAIVESDTIVDIDDFVRLFLETGEFEKISF